MKGHTPRERNDASTNQKRVNNVAYRILALNTSKHLFHLARVTATVSTLRPTDLMWGLSVSAPVRLRFPAGGVRGSAVRDRFARRGCRRRRSSLGGSRSESESSAAACRPRRTCSTSCCSARTQELRGRRSFLDGCSCLCRASVIFSVAT